jgi:hypothetical protein
MEIESEITAMHDIKRGILMTNAISLREGIEPQSGIFHQTCNNTPGDSFKRKSVVAAPNAFFPSANIALDVRHVVVSSATV